MRAKKLLEFFCYPINVGCPITAESCAEILYPLNAASTQVGESRGRSPLHQAAAFLSTS